jgi:hypothetical protein
MKKEYSDNTISKDATKGISLTFSYSKEMQNEIEVDKQYDG